MSALIAPSELPQWVPGEILCASDNLGWNGVELRSYHYKGLDVAVPAMRDFVVISYRRGGTFMERRFEGAWTQTKCLPGDVSLLTRSQQSHWHWTEDIDVAHVYLSEKLVSNVANEVMDRSVADVRLHDVLKTEDPIVTAAVDTIAREAQQQSMGSALYVESVATQLAVHLLRHYASVTLREACGKGHLSPTQARRITEYIDTRLHEPLNLESLATVTGLGVWSFGRRFRHTFGCAPHSYVISRRVERAQRLLTQGIMPVKEIASACGFADQAHRLFSFITMNWRGRPLISHEVIVNLIASTKTRNGLKVRAELDRANYPKGLVVSDDDFAAIKIERNDFHGDWNYRIRSG